MCVMLMRSSYSFAFICVIVLKSPVYVASYAVKKPAIDSNGTHRHSDVFTELEFIPSVGERRDGNSSSVANDSVNDGNVNPQSPVQSSHESTEQQQKPSSLMTTLTALLNMNTEHRQFRSSYKKAAAASRRPRRRSLTTLPGPGATFPGGNKNNDVMCRRHDLWVDVEQLGWQKTLIYPKRFNIFYCSGRCNPRFILHDSDSTNHAILKSLVRSRLGRRAAPPGCCVPTKLAALSLILVERESIVVKHHRDAVVDKCGCR